jgi:hypothetical protein
LAVVLNVAALSGIINRGLPLRAMNELSFRWNSSASWLLVSSRHFPSSLFLILHLNGPAKSPSLTSNGSLASVLKLGMLLVNGDPYGYVEYNLQILQLLINFFTFDLSCGIHHCSLKAAMVFATPKCLILL